MYPPVHKRPPEVFTFDRLQMLWDRSPRYHEMTTFATLEELLEEHESCREDFEDLREEYLSLDLSRFLVQLSWSDLVCRHATMERIRAAGQTPENPFVRAFMDQFRDLDTDRNDDTHSLINSEGTTLTFYNNGTEKNNQNCNISLAFTVEKSLLF